MRFKKHRYDEAELPLVLMFALIPSKAGYRELVPGLPPIFKIT